MKNYLNLLNCFFGCKKIFSVKKKKFVIFDCVNSDIISKILPTKQTCIVSTRINKINKLLINFRTFLFLIENFFSRSIQLNYFISLIDQIEPKFVITTIDNSISFSILSKYFEKKIKFIAIQNATRGGIYENTGNLNKNLFYTNYMGFSNFDFKLMKKKKVKVKKFISIGSLRNSFYKSKIFSKKKNQPKKYDICLVSKNIFSNGKYANHAYAKATIIICKYIVEYLKKNNRSIIIQAKTNKNSPEEKFYKKLFHNTNYKISWGNKIKLTSYESVTLSKLVIGTASSLLREASIYPNTKILSYDIESKKNKNPFSGINYIKHCSYKEFEKRLNYLFSLRLNKYEKLMKKKKEYLMNNTNSISVLHDFLNKKNKELI